MSGNNEMSEMQDLDTIVVPAHPKGFNQVFLGEKRWPNLKMDKIRRPNVKFVAVYQTSPVSAITHYAEIERLEDIQKHGRYDVWFKGSPVEIRHVPFTKTDICAVQGPRYTMLERLLNAASLNDAF